IFDLHGRELEQVKAPADGEVFGIRTLPPVKAGEWCIFFAVLDSVIR
ncbi:MAG: hypothetical protein GX605_05655, partial [Chloroflexi bacterium]|nr:hypothetical protein [Chloroflexota bacterium]